MPATGTKTRKNRDEKINLRASQSQKALIDPAADVLGKNRSDFMLETACREAEAVLLDRRYFALPSEEFKRFTAMLDNHRPAMRSCGDYLGLKRRGSNESE